MAARNLTHGQLLIKDGAGTPLSLTVPIEMGDLKWSEPKETHTIHDRKTIKGHTEGRDQPCEVSFTLVYEVYRGDTGETTPVDALTKSGPVGATWTSTEADGPYSVNLEFQITSPDTSKHEKIVFDDFHVTGIEVSEGEDSNKISVSGRCKVARPTVTRVTSF